MEDFFLIKQIQRAKQIQDKNLNLEIQDDSLIIYLVEGNDTYQVSCIDGLWRCDCEDYLFAKDKNLGSYCCKHILKVIMKLGE